MTKTQLTILWGLGVLVVMVLGALGVVISQAGQPQVLAPTADTVVPTATERAPSAPYLMPETAYSARNLYGRAAQAARRWQSDAVLVSAAASWPFADLDALSMPVDWTFQFYSPATQRVYLVSANPADVSPIRETLSPYSLSAIPVDAWRVDSHQALNTWLNRGGGTLLKSHPIIDISMRLVSSTENGPVWTILGLDESGKHMWAERVDARGPQS
jgi:hypothetical protein